MRPPSPRLFRHRITVYAAVVPDQGPLGDMIPKVGEPTTYRAIVTRQSGDEQVVGGPAIAYAATFKIMVIAASDPKIEAESRLAWTDDGGDVRTLIALEESTRRNIGRYVITAGYVGPDQDGIDAPADGSGDGDGLPDDFDDAGFGEDGDEDDDDA